MPELTVRDCMHAGVIACAPDASLEEVAETMRQRHVSALVVVDGGLAVGLISKTDLVNASFVAPYMRYWRGLSARHLMSAPVVAVRPEAPLREALERLRRHRIHRVVVTEVADGGERPIGILSLTDVVQRLGAGPRDEAAKEAWR